MYTYQARNTKIYIVTRLIGLVGGLVTVLKLIVPRLVRLARYIQRKRRQIVPNTDLIENKDESYENDMQTITNIPM